MKFLRLEFQAFGSYPNREVVDFTTLEQKGLFVVTGPTGSGKTLAFGVPMLSRLDGECEPNRPLALVLVPTRELALQVAEVLAPVDVAEMEVAE